MMILPRDALRGDASYLMFLSGELASLILSSFSFVRRFFIVYFIIQLQILLQRPHLQLEKWSRAQEWCEYMN